MQNLVSAITSDLASPIYTQFNPVMHPTIALNEFEDEWPWPTLTYFSSSKLYCIAIVPLPTYVSYMPIIISLRYLGGVGPQTLLIGLYSFDMVVVGWGDWWWLGGVIGGFDIWNTCMFKKVWIFLVCMFLVYIYQ